MYQIVSEKFLLKNPKIYKECISSLTFYHPVILQFLIAAIFLLLSLIAKSKNVNIDFTMNPPITLAANETHLPFAAYRERNSRSDWNC